MEKDNQNKNKEVEDASSRSEEGQQACSSSVAEARLKALLKQMPDRKFLTEHDTSVSVSDSDDVAELSLDELSESGPSMQGVAGKRFREPEDGETAEDGLPEPKISPARRGRGRPPTTGKYIGVGAARAAQQAARREELARAQREYEERAQREDLMRQKTAETSPSRQPRRVPAPPKDAEDNTSVELDVRLQAALAKITNVGKVSKGLKGTCIRDLKEAVAEVNDIGQVLLSRTIDEETAKLKRENTRLSNQVAELRHEVDELRKELRNERRKGDSAESQDSVSGDIRRLMAEMEARFAARLSAFEGIGLRPPLGAAAKKSVPKVAEASATKPPAKKTAVKDAPAPAVNPKSLEGRWETVGAKKKEAKAAKKAAKAAKKAAMAPKEGPKAAAPKPPKLRVPKSSAVVITLQPAAAEKGVSYAQILLKAKANIDLASLGIAGMRLKQARTGARMLEIPGASTGEKADALAAKLRATFPDGEVKVSRPVKRADVRVSGLDDTADQDEVLAAIVRAGGCRPDEIKVGPIRRRGSGPGTTVISCPIAVAQKLADGRRIYVGWVSAQARLLPPRPTRCYRCFAEGHLGAQCTSPVDCSGRCFRCGGVGHQAKDCSAAPHCAVCAAADRPADHRVGAKTCSINAGKRKGATTTTKVAPAVAPTAPSNTEGVAMES